MPEETKPVEREGFERWLEDQPELKYGFQPPQRTERGYAYGPTQIAWMAWQASADAALERAAQAVREMGEEYTNIQTTYSAVALATNAIRVLKRKPLMSKPRIAKQNYATGYSLDYALAHKYERPRKPRLPSGWRWIACGEYAEVGDVCCDSRFPPVTIIYDGWKQTKSNHPVRTKRKNAVTARRRLRRETECQTKKK